MDICWGEGFNIGVESVFIVEVAGLGRCCLGVRLGYPLQVSAHSSWGFCHV